VCDALGFDERARQAGAVVTGEGRLDATTLEGKVVGEVAGRCRRLGVPLHAVVGADRSSDSVTGALGLASVTEAGDAESIRAAAIRLAGA
jgi:glycerate kinase